MSTIKFKITYVASLDSAGVDTENLTVNGDKGQPSGKEAYMNIFDRNKIKCCSCDLGKVGIQMVLIKLKKKKDQNKLIRLAQIRNMKSSYQMDSSHSRQQSESRGQERGRLGGGCPSKREWLPAADWSLVFGLPCLDFTFLGPQLW